MENVTYLSVKVEKKMKELFFLLCREEGIEISQGVRELLAEALARGYISKERKERMKKIVTGGEAKRE